VHTSRPSQLPRARGGIYINQYRTRHSRSSIVGEMAWQPQPGPLVQLSQCLRGSLSGHDIAAQKNAEQVGDACIFILASSLTNIRCCGKPRHPRT